jgi:hypothetical protein
MLRKNEQNKWETLQLKILENPKPNTPAGKSRNLWEISQII